MDRHEMASAKSTTAASDFEAQSPPPSRFERAIPFRESKGPLGPFRATQIWKDLIQHLKTKVELKRRRHKMRYVESCFTGTDAVDVVLHFLLNDKDTFSADLSREKAVKVCQMLMHRKIFHSALDKPGCDKISAFEDSSGKLYQFIGEHAIGSESFVDLEEVDEASASGGAQNVTLCSEKIRLSQHGFEPEEEPVDVKAGANTQPLQEIHHNSSSEKPASSTIGDLTLTPGRPIRKLLPEEVEEVWKEVTLTQLLTLVDLTFLDGILSEDKRSKQQLQRDHLIISNVVARNWHLPLTPTSLETPSDSLLQTAMDCIECLPKGHVLLNEPIFKRCGMEAKLWAKDIIIQHYTSLNECLLPQRFLELHMAILNLILAEQADNALMALQLYRILLPVAVREELYRLLRFMRSLAADTSLRIESQESNEMAVLRLLSSCIFHHKLLADTLAQKLIQFMMTHIDKMFTIPREVRKKVAVKFYQLKTGKSMLGCESSFCNRVSKEEFERQSRDCTEESLIDLMNSILDDTSISLKEKKLRLKQFQKSYPVLYEQNFDGML